MRKIALLMALVFIVGGCIASTVLSELVTPATVNKAAVKYAAEAGVIDANSYRGYANLAKAKRLKVAMNSAYAVKTLSLDQMRDRNELDFGILMEVVNRDNDSAEQREEIIFGKTGLISAILPALGLGGFGGILGLMRKRPGDITKDELGSALATAGMEVDEQHEMLTEVVTGVQKFIDTYNMSEDGTEKKLVADLKGALTMANSAPTRVSVAAIKSQMF